jgi:outer membrane protein assembly factor BamB
MMVALLAALALLSTACATIGSANGWPALAVTSDGVLITQVDEGRVAAIDPADGRQLWLFPDQLPGGAIDPANEDIELGATYATPVIDGNAVYLVSYDGLAVRVDIDENRIEVGWYAALVQEVVATPVLSEGRLYIATDDGDVAVLNTESGAIEQQYALSAGRIWGRPALDGGTLYLSDLDGRATMALDIASGAIIWETGLTAASPADLVQDGDQLIVGSFDRALHALDVTTGEERWRFDGDGWFVGPPLVDGDTLYAATMRGTIYALDRTGTEVWSYEMDGEEVRAAPLLVNGTVVVATRDGLAVGLDAETGTQQWESPIEGAKVNAHGLLLDSDIYYITTDHELLRVDASTGAVQRFSVAR